MASLTASQELRALGKAPKASPAREPDPAKASGPVRDSGSSGGSASEPPSPDSAYGPDDPGYGPPDADWYERRKRERELELEREEEEFLAEAAEETPKTQQPASSVFEPKPRQSGSSGPPEETSLDQFLKSDDGTDFERDPLNRVKDMYLAAETVSDSDLDRRFEELLERQKGLIGAYLSQSRPPMPEGTAKRAG